MVIGMENKIVTIVQIPTELVDIDFECIRKRHEPIPLCVH